MDPKNIDLLSDSQLYSELTAKFIAEGLYDSEAIQRNALGSARHIERNVMKLLHGGSVVERIRAKLSRGS